MTMKRLYLAIFFACCLLAMTAQDVIRVKYQGAKPNISDFVSALVSSRGHVDEEECCVDESFNALYNAWNQHLKGLPLNEGETLTVDEENGFVLYESRYEQHLLRIEMCYWNESDRKHRLFAYSVSSFTDDKYNPGQYDVLTFYRYDNASKKMDIWNDVGFDVVYGIEGGVWLSYALPRTGKDITVTSWYESGKKERALKWNGHGFSY